MVVAAGFESGLTVGMSLRAGPMPVGAAITIKDPKAAPLFASSVLRAFTESGISLDHLVNVSLPADEVRVIIGLKPK